VAIVATCVNHLDFQTETLPSAGVYPEKDMPLMANYIITYDLNGPRPSHQEMDKFLEALAANRGRVLETVWWVDYAGTAPQLRDRLRTILGEEDLLLVIEAKSAAWTTLLVDSKSLITAWENAA
jgi:hypothetical protein